MAPVQSSIGLMALRLLAARGWGFLEKLPLVSRLANFMQVVYAKLPFWGNSRERHGGECRLPAAENGLIEHPTPLTLEAGENNSGEENGADIDALSSPGGDEDSPEQEGLDGDFQCDPSHEALRQEDYWMQELPYYQWYVGDEDDEYNDFYCFREILKALDFDRLSQQVLVTRQRSDPEYAGGAPTVTDQTCGSFNICFELTFDDGVRWMLRVPCTGTKEKWAAISARALENEARTMMLLKKWSTIPLPEVFAFSATPDNELGFPYIIMPFVDGKSAYEVWFGHDYGLHSAAENEKCRRRILEGVASSMKQLGRFTFYKGGFLKFCEDGTVSGVGPMRMMNYKAMNDGSMDDAYFETGPFLYPEDQYLAALEMLGEADSSVDLLKELLRCVPENAEEKDEFDLAHPDLDLQNIIVSDDGTVQAIIDWDGVAAVPMSIGSRKYPLWLTQDWQFYARGWEGPPSEFTPAHKAWKHRDDMIKGYRQMYQQLLDEAHPELEIPALGRDAAKDFTRWSLVAGTVYHAAMIPIERKHTVMGLMDKLAEVAAEGVEVNYYKFLFAIEDGELDDEMLDNLEEAFASLLKAV